MKETTTMIIFLKNWLSNFAKSPIVEDGINFLQVEQYYMFHKAKFFGDVDSMTAILNAQTPAQACDLGQLVKPFNDSWNEVRYEIMLKGNLLKYQQNAELKEKLLATGNKILVEANPVDRIWGIGLSEDDPKASNPSKWQGLNLLGLCLMEVRTTLSNRDSSPII